MAGIKNSNYFDFLKKLAPVLAKEEGDVVNRQLAKEMAERGAQLDNPTMAEQLKGIKLPEEKSIRLPDEYFPPPSAEAGSHLGDVIPEYKQSQHDLNLGEIIPDPKNPSIGLNTKSRVEPYVGEEIPVSLNKEPLHIDNINLDSSLGEVIPGSSPSESIEQLGSKWNWLKNNKGKLAVGGAAAGIYALSGNDDRRSLKNNASTEVPSTTSANALKAAEIEQPETEEEKAVKAQIRQLSSTPSGSSDHPTVVDFGSSPSIASLERLQQLQQQANEQSRWARVAQAFSQGRAGMAGEGDDRFSKGYDEDIKAFQAIPEQYKEQVAFEKEDPNSAQSQGYRNLAKSMGFEIKGNASAADIERQFPQLANIYNQKEARKARAEDLKLRYASMQDTKRQAAELKNQEKQTKAIENYAKIASKEYEKLSKLEQAVQALDMKNIEDGGPEDVAALYSFIKLLDPESVVREGEIALARSGMSMPQRLRNAIKNAVFGGVIDKEFRAEMAIIGKHLAEQGSSRYHKSLAHHRNILKNRYNLKDDDIAEYDPALVASKQTEFAPQPPSAGSKEPVGASGLTASQRQAEIQKLRQELGNK